MLLVQRSRPQVERAQEENSISQGHKGSIHRFEEDIHERRVHFEDEAEMGTFDVCILENIMKDEHDEDSDWPTGRLAD